MRRNAERGIALITVLLILTVVSAIVVGMSWMVMTDQRLGGNYKDRQAAFYGAEAGMEKITADLGNVFATKGAVTSTDLTTAPITTPPTITGITYANTLGSTYQVSCNGCPAAPVTTNATILAPSPYSGMQGLITPFTLTVAAQTTDGSEVKLQRQIQLVAIPVFQFGIFSTTDLSFFAGPVFDFGGRVHTNGNLWLSANSGPLYLADKVTASGQIILSNLENGYPGGGGVITAGGTYGGNVNISTAPLPIPPNPTRPPYVAAQWQTLLPTQGSVLGPTAYGAVGTAAPNPTWAATVTSFSPMLKNATPQLNLTSSALGGLTQPIFLIERPLVGEQAANPGQFNERYFAGGASTAGTGQASVRILLDDYGTDGTCATADMLALDTVTATVPVDLATLTAKPAWWANQATFYPLPTAKDSGAYSAVNGYWLANGAPIITGCLKVETESAGGVFTDVTQDVLNQGFIGRNINPQGACSGRGCTNTVAPSLVGLPGTGTVMNPQGPPNTGSWIGCTDPNPNAILRFARLRDNPTSATSGGCGTASLNGYDYWPLALYDPREGVSRDNAMGNNAGGNPYITAQGVMYYVELDVTNLQRWLLGAIGLHGAAASNVGGYMLYFSDRRGNQIDNTAGVSTNGTKTGSFGFNDIINGTSDPNNGCPNGSLDSGEDFVGDGILRTYGGRPLSAGPALADDPPLPGFLASTPNLVKNTNCAATAPITPNYMYNATQEARENPPVFFRRALKLVNGQTINLGTACFGAAPNPPCGLTMAAENPVYVQGEYNDGGVNDGSWGGSSVAASVAGDAVTMLSDNWNDVNSFISPYDPNSRPGVTTSYRTGIIAGKGIPFLQPAGTAQDYGTDGGLHNFLRYIETWNGTLYYQGSLVSFYYSAQATGPYKCCTTVYNPPTRGYFFDQNFTTGPQWLPPRTPTLRSINTVGFSQDILPTQ